MSVLEVADRDEEDQRVELPPVPDDHGPSGPLHRRPRLQGLWRPETLLAIVLVACFCGFVFIQLQPSKLFLNSTPAGGDMGAHVWQPAYLRDHLLHHLRLTGWAPDWYAGFPSLVFYFPLPSLMIVIANVILPYGVAFKLVSVLGLVTLPFAIWAFGRLARMPFPGPLCLAAASLPFLFSRNFTIYGGNIASTLAGEFGFSISLAAAFIFLGLVARGMETGRYRAWAALALTVTGLCHLLPTIFAVVGALVLTLMYWDRRRWRWTLPVLTAAACLAAFWSLPFLFRLPYATDMGYEKLTQYGKNLFPGHMAWLLALAPAGFLVSIIRRNRIGLFLSVMAGLSLLIFRFAPQARLWNARVLPFWFLCLYLLAGVAVAECGSILAESLGPNADAPVVRWSILGLPVVAALAALLWVGFPLHVLPFGHTNAKTGQYQWLGFKSSDRSFIPDWVSWNYSGYEATTKARRAEYFDLIKTMQTVGRTEGCGRAMWEYEPELDQMGTPDALMLLPYWTNSCIGSMEGLYYESSATTPYHFLNAAELSLHPSDPVRGLSYPTSPDVNAGVRHLQLLGVKYYMAITSETQAQADINPDLRVVAKSGPWSVSYTSGGTSSVKQRTWKIYEVLGSDVVSPLVNQPVVMKVVPKGGNGWLKPSQSWYLNPDVADVMYAASGPSSWKRVAPDTASPPRNAVQPVLIDKIVQRDDSISFNVDAVGVPVLVKVSYFPNWQVSGARGPYRVAPNLMVVIPTSHHVRLHYGYTPVDWVGYLLGLAALAGVVWMARAKPLVFAAPRHRQRTRSAGATAPRPEVWPAAVTTAAWPAGPPAAPEVRADGQAGDPYERLQHELTGAFPVVGGDSPEEDIDGWVGFPHGLDPDLTQVMPVVDPSPTPGRRPRPLRPREETDPSGDG